MNTKKEEWKKKFLLGNNYPEYTYDAYHNLYVHILAHVLAHAPKGTIYVLAEPMWALFTYYYDTGKMGNEADVPDERLEKLLISADRMLPF